ncbi:glycoside hydrolase family 43 [Gemmatirosa kalamazoonensis]|uniref:Glycoside hydrolase family 43 n=1 Tax=Gemmatirosa kalamazoonensis TaxID=861299 RepID=W0RC46_9BACT|nr:glycoside hydrolase family 43 protein [Gemmatirosa kalamazoonensis]AHG88022.1 glycoside hydrolase family 43 [Gemmatirosa kalamazoonensis]
MPLTSRREFLAQLAGAAGAAGLTALGAPLLAAQPRSYTNPVYAGSMPDPGVLLHQGVYYAFGTTGKDRKSDGRIFTLLRSRNLFDWEELGGALTPPSTDARYEYWAPEPAFDGGKFYLYYAQGGIEEEKFAVRVAVADRPEGPYVDTGTPLVDCTGNRFTIDPHPYRDTDGTWYLFYARNYPNTEGGFHPGTGLAADRLVGMTKLAGECRTILRARYPWTLYEAHRRMNVYDATFDWHTIEAPYVRRHGGKYYLFYSGSNWQTPNYGVDYAVADHVLGPYTGQGQSARVLRGSPGGARGPGHHAIVTGPDGRDWVLYHAWNKEMTVRQLCVDPLRWTPDGPRCTPTVAPQKVTK